MTSVKYLKIFVRPLHESRNLLDNHIFVSHTYLGPTASFSNESIISSASTIPYVEEKYVIHASRSSTSGITIYSDESDDESSNLYTHFVPRSDLEDSDAALINSANTFNGAETPSVSSFPRQSPEDVPINEIARETNVTEIINPSEEQVIIDASPF